MATDLQDESGIMNPGHLHSRRYQAPLSPSHSNELVKKSLFERLGEKVDTALKNLGVRVDGDRIQKNRASRYEDRYQKNNPYSQCVVSGLEGMTCGLSRVSSQPPKTAQDAALVGFLDGLKKTD